ncbi:MAG: energy-coupling factor ABC transporter permease [Anaerolineaceae bacterium]|nr:energy-coupling factor ABC transporter permease [Anaerolineaceae bacterium]
MHYSPVAMHIPDGFLSILVSILFWIVSVIVIAMAIKNINKNLSEKQIPLMGILAAAIFAGQMLNFSVTGGTSGHLLGAALATILLGPWPAVIVMTAVVSTQAIIFQDGGMLALGANLFNMAVLGVFVSYAIYRLIQRSASGKSWGLFTGSAVSSWASIFIASLSAALMLALSGTSPANIAVPAMAAIHALIGVGEAIITVGAISFLFAARKDLFQETATTPSNNRPIIIGGAIITIALAILSPLASSHPDGLEWVAEQNGFLALAQESLYQVVPDYVMPGITNEGLATILAGIIGSVLVFFAAFFTARSRKQRKIS